MNIAKNISVCLRWALALILVFGSLIWLYEAEQTMPQGPRHTRAAQPQQPEELPSPETMQHISRVLATVDNLPDGGRQLTAVDASMFFAPDLIQNADTRQAIRPNELRLIFVGPYTSYAFYNGQAVKPGDSLNGGGKVLNIDKQGITVLTTAKGPIKKIFWQTPGFVQFTKAPPVIMKRTKASGSSTGEAAEKTAPLAPENMETKSAEPMINQLQKIAKKQ